MYIESKKTKLGLTRYVLNYGWINTLSDSPTFKQWIHFRIIIFRRGQLSCMFMYPIGNKGDVISSLALGNPSVTLFLLFVCLWNESISNDLDFFFFFLVLFLSTRHICRLPGTCLLILRLCHLRKKGSILLAHRKKPPMKATQN